MTRWSTPTRARLRLGGQNALSPASDTGSPGINPVGDFDIVGNARVRGVHVDIGAWESSGRVFADMMEH